MTDRETFLDKLVDLVQSAVAQGMDPGDVADALKLMSSASVLKLMSDSVDEVLSTEDDD